MPFYVVSTNVGKIPMMFDNYIVERTEEEVILRNYNGELTTLPNVTNGKECQTVLRQRAGCTPSEFHWRMTPQGDGKAVP
jgi:hypothetical protein